MELAVGKDIASVCGKCGDVWHVIVSVEGSKVTKVQCKMCSGYHRYKRSPSDTTTPVATPRRKVEGKAGAKGRKVTRAAPGQNSPQIQPNLDLPVRNYSMRETYQTGERIEHPKFGQGVVESFPTPDKMNVFFEDGRKTLAQGRLAV
jgi:hypothetical protein